MRQPIANEAPHLSLAHQKIPAAIEHHGCPHVVGAPGRPAETARFDERFQRFTERRLRATGHRIAVVSKAPLGDEHRASAGSLRDGPAVIQQPRVGRRVRVDVAHVGEIAASEWGDLGSPYPLRPDRPANQDGALGRVGADLIDPGLRVLLPVVPGRVGLVHGLVEQLVKNVCLVREPWRHRLPERGGLVGNRLDVGYLVPIDDDVETVRSRLAHRRREVVSEIGLGIELPDLWKHRHAHHPRIEAGAGIRQQRQQARRIHVLAPVVEIEGIRHGYPPENDGASFGILENAPLRVQRRNSVRPAAGASRAGPMTGLERPKQRQQEPPPSQPRSADEQADKL